MMPWRLLVGAALAAIVLVAAGCGGDDGTAGGETLAAETTAAGDTSADTGATTETEAETGAGGAGASGACQKLVDLAEAYGKALAAAGSGGDSGDIAESAEVFQRFADEVPEEVRDDFQVMADAFSRYAEVLADVDLSSGETPDADTIAKLQTLFTGDEAEEVQAASDRISAWSNENCAP
jgi:hypothetical protein